MHLILRKLLVTPIVNFYMKEGIEYGEERQRYQVRECLSDKSKTSGSNVALLI